MLRAEDRYTTDPTTQNLDALQEARAEYASTVSGADALLEQVAAVKTEPATRERDEEVARLQSALNRGWALREGYRAAQRRIKAEQQVHSSDSAIRVRAINSQAGASYADGNNLSDETLTRLAADESREVRLALARYKGQLPDAALERLLSDDREIACVATKRPLSPEHLQLAARHPDSAVLRATYTGTSQQWPIRSREHVLFGLTHDDPAVRGAAIGAFWRQGVDSYNPDNFLWEPPSDDVVASLLQDRSKKVRDAADHVFGRLATPTP